MWSFKHNSLVTIQLHLIQQHVHLDQKRGKQPWKPDRFPVTPLNIVINLFQKPQCHVKFVTSGAWSQLKWEVRSGR